MSELTWIILGGVGLWLWSEHEAAPASSTSTPSTSTSTTKVGGINLDKIGSDVKSGVDTGIAVVSTFEHLKDDLTGGGGDDDSDEG